MAYKFPSLEWMEQFVTEINSSEAYATAAKTWEGDVILVINGVGGVYLDLWHGQCRGAEYLNDPQARKAEFTIAAGLDTWKKVLANKLDPVQGMMTRQIKLEGNLVKIMKHVKAAQELVRCATRVETVYE
jgi:putative sterol carrier protein